MSEAEFDEKKFNQLVKILGGLIAGMREVYEDDKLIRTALISVADSYDDFVEDDEPELETQAISESDSAK